MANVRLSAARRAKTARDLALQTELPKNTRARSRELKRAANQTEAEIQRLRAAIAAGSDRSLTARRSMSRQEQERRETITLVAQVCMLGVIILATIGWMNQRFAWW
jgi:hypothetical protein